MEQFRIIYRILRILQRAMKSEEFDREAISAETLGVSEAMWRRIMAILVKNGYIEGVKVIRHDQSDVPIIRFIGCPEITLTGLQYLEENSMMKKAADLAKGIIDIVT